MEDHLEQVMLKEKEEKLSMSRVPKKTKELFLNIANEDYSGDYGMLLVKILNDSIEYDKLKDMFFNNKIKLVCQND